jgi:hypothetical protein
MLEMEQFNTRRSNMPEQVYSAQEAEFGSPAKKLSWYQGFDVVPEHRTLEITTFTLNFFPKDTGTLGRAGIGARDAAGNTMWALQSIYVEPKKTTHLTFPRPLRLEAGGYVEIEFVLEGPGTILVEANGALV